MRPALFMCRFPFQNFIIVELFDLFLTAGIFQVIWPFSAFFLAKHDILASLGFPSWPAVRNTFGGTPKQIGLALDSPYGSILLLSFGNSRNYLRSVSSQHFMQPYRYASKRKGLPGPCKVLLPHVSDSVTNEVSLHLLGNSPASERYCER